MIRAFMLIVMLLIFLLAADSTTAFTLWNDIRASALLPDDRVIIRAENAQDPGFINTILYAQSGIQETALTPVNDGPSTLEATVPGPVSIRRYYGFRLVQESAMDLLTVGLVDGVVPGPSDLTRLAEDPIGDEISGYLNLDLTDCRIGRDSTHLFCALTNAGGGFPVNDGLTFFSYLLGIKNPADSEPDTLFAMIHTVTAVGIIEPGLYQINGTGVNDLVKIGEISTVELPGENTLILSCELEDLEANPVFQSWYNPTDPRIDVAGFSQKITILGGVVESDSTPGGIWHLREVALEPGPNQLPQLAGLVLPQPGTGGFVSVVYSDADGHCPVIAELVFDDSEVYPLLPQTLNYAAPVAYHSAAGLTPLETGEWSLVVARFSDNLSDVVELEQMAVGVADSHSRLQVQATPNPFSSRTEVAFSLASFQPVQLAVYNLAGRRVATLVNTTLPAGFHTFAWNGRDEAGRPQSAGVYFYRLQTPEQEVVRRLALVH